MPIAREGDGHSKQDSTKHVNAMRQDDHNPRHSVRAEGLGGMVAVLFCLGLFVAAPAAATSWEQIGCFAGTLPGPTESCKPVSEEEFGEEVQLGGVGGMAVNYTGAGGVPKGSVYAAGVANGNLRITMFVPDGEGLKFRLAWQVELDPVPYVRCGPGLAVPTECPARVKKPVGKVDVDVDETTGNVYVHTGTKAAGRKAVVAYSPEGEKELTRFGEIAAAGETTPETPGQIHESPYPGGIAVNGAGEVYVFDINTFGKGYFRLMKFVPKTAGKFDDYEYAGSGEDIATGFEGEGKRLPTGPVADAAGDLYVGAGAEADRIEKYDAGSPGDPPVCKFTFAKSGITAATVDPLSGEVFFFSFKAPKRIRQLSPCDEGTEEFKETGAITVKPQRDDLWGLALDPARELAGRGAGVLYGAAPDTEPNSGVGAGEPGQSSLGYIFAHPEENPPEVVSQSVSNVTATTAQLHAEIDPHGILTHYAFQYMTEEAFEKANETFTGAAEAPPGGGEVEGTGIKKVRAAISGLWADIAYVFRTTAESACKPGEPSIACAVETAMKAFHTYPDEARHLPDDRAYELVSPPQKHGGQVISAEPRINSCSVAECKPRALAQFPRQVTPSGNGIAYEGTPFSPGQGAVIENQYIARRDADEGWQNANPTPKLLQSSGGLGYKAFDPELESAIFEQLGSPLSPEAPPEYENLYSQPTSEPLDLSSLLGEGPPNRSATGSGSFKILYSGASSDLSRVFLQANDALTGETASAPAAEDGGADKFNLYEWEPATGALRLVNVLPGNTETKAGASFEGASAGAISDDGSRVFWSDGVHLYVRDEGEVTREILSASGFLAASTDGSKALLDDGCFYDLEIEECTDLTEGKGGFQGIVGQSEDLSHIYFVDTAVLSGEGENSEGDKAQAGAPNLYSWQEGTTAFVATLVAKDNAGGDPAVGVIASDWDSAPTNRTAQASPNGRFAAFLSFAPLTGYDNTGPCDVLESGPPVILGPGPCPEAFVYDSATGKLSCASCNPSGAAPLGSTVLRRIDTATPSMPQPRYLTDTGRLFFDSRDSLSQFDTNEGVEDVYEFEPEGVGDCERVGGCVAPVSAGREGDDSNFLAMDESGDNVFFTSRDRLLGVDEDELVDLYDARVDGGFPGESELPTLPCQSEGCQQIPPAPPEQPPSSQTFTDPGNVPAAKPCKKGQVKKKGKCVKKKHKPKKSKRKHGAAK